MKYMNTFGKVVGIISNLVSVKVDGPAIKQSYKKRFKRNIVTLFNTSQSLKAVQRMTAPLLFKLNITISF